MSKKKIIVIGDCVLDEYLRLRSKNNNLERGHRNEPIPQYDIVGILKRLGGAHNVAYLIKNRLDGADVRFYTAMPREYISNAMLEPDLLENGSAAGSIIPVSPHGRWSVKRRYVMDETNRTLERHDYYKPMEKCEDKDVLEWVRHVDFGWADLVVMSDYRKGFFSKEVITHIIANSKMTVVDTKNPDLDMFVGADFIKLNFQEYMNVHGFYGVDDVAEHLVAHKLVVTRGSDDTLLIYSEIEDGEVTGFEVKIPAQKEDPDNILDTVGCGDAFVAGFAHGLLETGSPHKAIELGHWLAHVSISKLGAIW
jgi:D-beta-D-heptose 7-phosphate kinase/D-beta-D-heptose 1-phosphate adenosyltransferase